MVIIIFGVTGAGKTTVGRLLSAELGWRFYDADAFHAPPSIEKMGRGIPLADEDRRPWLERLRKLIAESLDSGENVVLACSALKEVYRRLLKVDDAVHYVYLKGNYSLIRERLKKRKKHFMNPALLRSQFDLMEEPSQDSLRIDARRTPPEIVTAIRSALKI